jgi:P-type Mg2+ transporter
MPAETSKGKLRINTRMQQHAGQPANRAAHDVPGSRGELPSRLLEIARMSDEQAFAALQARRAGLSAAEAAARLASCGPNDLTRDRERGVVAQILTRLANPLNVLLLLLASVSMLIRDRGAALLIFSMVVLSVLLSFIQERRSSQAAAKLRAMVHTTATVCRAGDATDIADTTWCEVPMAELVPGDLVHLSAGDLVPADLRLIAAKDLFVNQSALTGEALPVEKSPGPPAPGAADPVNLGNVCFMGTSVVSGTARATVVLTGPRAYFGRIAGVIGEERQLTDFDKGVNRFAWLMIRFILVMAPLVFLINGVRRGDWIEALLFAVAVAVGLTPEMLPMIVTVNLSKGALAMSHKKVIVKRLNSIQNFGAMDVLCTDKTGTLTQDRIILERHVDLLGHGSDEVLLYAYLNSHHQSGLKNLLDVAILQHPDCEKLSVTASEYRKFDEVPFDFNRRRMSVAVASQERRLLICKGAVEEVFAASRNGRAGGETFDLDETHLQALRAVSAQLNEDGFRVIAIAYRDLPSDQSSCSIADESNLTLLGYVAFLDPPKESARQALLALREHGVAVKVLTGDNEIITSKICREVGITTGQIVLGASLDALNEEELGRVAENGVVFAKLSPMQKARIIKALQGRGHVVGFLGDGINDAPALKAADVGVSVDSAVDIAKETADIILLEKSLLVLDDGVIEGRQVFGNIIKYIRMGASSNFGNMFSVIGASAWLPFLPMAPVQVLTNNLLYDFSQTSIPTDRVDPEYLQKPRRWEIGNIGRFMLLIGPISSVFDYLTYCLMYFAFAANTQSQAALFQTGWFVESLLSQTLIIHVIRTRRVPFFESRASTPMMVTSASICAIGIWLPTSPFAPALGLTALPGAYWPVLGVMLPSYLALTHVMKSWFHRRFGLD